MQVLQVGKIVNTHGLNGMVKVYPYTNAPQDFARFKKLYLTADLSAPLKVTAVKYHKNLVIVKFEGLNGIDDVLRLKNSLLYAEKDAADHQLADDEYFIEDLIGLAVLGDDGSALGRVCAFRESAQQVVLEVADGAHIWYLPFVDAFVETVDFTAGQLHVKLIAGLYGED